MGRNSQEGKGESKQSGASKAKKGDYVRQRQYLSVTNTAVKLHILRIASCPVNWESWRSLAMLTSGHAPPLKMLGAEIRVQKIKV